MDSNISHGQASGGFRNVDISYRILKISWTDKMSTQELLRRASTNRQLIKKGTLESPSTLLLYHHSGVPDKDHTTTNIAVFGHLTRRNNIRIALIEGKVNGKRERGRPRISWGNDLMKLFCFSYPDLMRPAQDRRRWTAA